MITDLMQQIRSSNSKTKCIWFGRNITISTIKLKTNEVEITIVSQSANMIVTVNQMLMDKYTKSKFGKTKLNKNQTITIIPTYL